MSVLNKVEENQLFRASGGTRHYLKLRNFFDLQHHLQLEVSTAVLKRVKPTVGTGVAGNIGYHSTQLSV